MFCSNLQSAILPEDSKIEVLDNFGGGLNTQFTSNKILKNQSGNIKNYLIDEKPNSLVPRKGYIIAGSTSTLARITKQFLFVKNNGEKEYIVTDSSRVFTTKDFKSYTVIKNTLTPTAMLDIDQVREEVWFTNGTDPIFTWDGTNHKVLDGSGDTPNVPRCKFISYFQERVFLYNSSSSNYGLYFSALTSTDGISISPDDSRAWPVTNQLNIGQGDNQSGTGMIPYRGQLSLHKDSSIYTLFGTDTDSYFARKTNSEVGAISDDSIVIGDNFQYFMTKNGIYAFDGGDAVRISDLISPNIEEISSVLTRIIENKWDSETEFRSNTQFNGSTVTSDGFVTVLTTQLVNAVNHSDIGITSEYGYTFINGDNSSSTAYADITTRVVDTSNLYSGHIARIGFYINSHNIQTVTLRITLKNKNTESEISVGGSFNPPTGVFNVSHWFIDFPSTFPVTVSEVMNGSIQAKIELATSNLSGSYNIFVSSIMRNGRGDVFLRTSTAQFISEISTLTTLTFWDTFLSNHITNEGNISYFIRAATSATNISTETWVGISPGSIINLPTAKNYVQWATTINALSTLSPQIDNVTIRHNEGTSSDSRPFATMWKNRYWLSASTQAGGDFSTIYVKSKNTHFYPNSFTNFLGINIRSFLKDGDDTFYAGSSTAGVIFRLDFGTNDNGLPIDYIYDTPDLVLSSPYFVKNLIKLVVDGKKSVGTTSVTLGISVDEGNFTNKTINFSGSGKLVRHIPATEFFGGSFKFRFRSNELDRAPEINSLAIVYIDSEKEVNE